LDCDSTIQGGLFVCQAYPIFPKKIENPEKWMRVGKIDKQNFFQNSQKQNTTVELGLGYRLVFFGGNVIKKQHRQKTTGRLRSRLLFFGTGLGRML